MCAGSPEKFGLIELDINDLKVIYTEPLESLINISFAENGSDRHINIPLLIDRDNYIIDGHHRYWYMLGKKFVKVKAIRLNMTFAQSKNWRDADNNIKAFSVITGRPQLYEGFKTLVNTLHA